MLLSSYSLFYGGPCMHVVQSTLTRSHIPTSSALAVLSPSSQFFHILPQWIFLRLVPTPSAIDLRYVGNVQPTCARSTPTIVNNTAEGRGRVIRVSTDDLQNQSRGGATGARVLSRMDALYQPDAEVWRLLSANGGALNLVV